MSASGDQGHGDVTDYRRTSYETWETKDAGTITIESPPAGQQKKEPR